MLTTTDAQSGLEKKLSKGKEFLSKHKDFIIPATAMIASAIADYYFTQLNFTGGSTISEGNPIINNAIQFYGENLGMLIPKIGFTAVALGVAHQIDYGKKQFKRLKGKHLMYTAAVLNTIAAAGNIAYHLI